MPQCCLQTHHGSHQQRLLGRLYSSYRCWQHWTFCPKILQIPEHTRTLPTWLFDARLFVRDRLNSSRPDAILVTYLLTLNHLPLPTCNRCSMIDLMDKCAELTSLTLERKRKEKGKEKEKTRLVVMTQPAWLREFNANKREIHRIEVKYCEDTRPGHQLEASTNLLSRSRSGAGGCQPPSGSPLVFPFFWWGRLTALRANVSPFPELMQGVFCWRSLSFLSSFLFLSISLFPRYSLFSVCWKVPAPDPSAQRSGCRSLII